ncbi:hypothetical protein YSA_03510 [Pseudomonas putida ND6]|jgi:hypothetical protein|uniref:Uncharacterized protein n=1 Tax=Pseudomonas putida ND6 TaxID=231023 RepID=I3UT45_PSEPU|nr:hypothetical protein YSA_03510 [Pseudomonas putida ND6]
MFEARAVKIRLGAEAVDQKDQLLAIACLSSLWHSLILFNLEPGHPSSSVVHPLHVMLLYVCNVVICRPSNARQSGSGALPTPLP